MVLTKDFEFEFRFDLTNEHFTVINIAKMWLLNSIVVIVATDIDQACKSQEPPNMTYINVHSSGQSELKIKILSQEKIYGEDLMSLAHYIFHRF